MTAVGVEPTTIALKVRCSTTELRDHSCVAPMRSKGTFLLYHELSRVTGSELKAQLYIQVAAMKVYLYPLMEVHTYHVMYTRK